MWWRRPCFSAHVVRVTGLSWLMSLRSPTTLLGLCPREPSVAPSCRPSERAAEVRWLVFQLKTDCPRCGYCEDATRQDSWTWNLEHSMAPCVTVPGIQHSNIHTFLKLTSRRHWGRQFEDWLELVHTGYCTSEIWMLRWLLPILLRKV